MVFCSSLLVVVIYQYHFSDKSYIYNIRLVSLFNIIQLAAVCTYHFPSIAHPNKSLILYVCEFGMIEFNYAVGVTENIGLPVFSLAI